MFYVRRKTTYTTQHANRRRFKPSRRQDVSASGSKLFTCVFEVSFFDNLLKMSIYKEEQLGEIFSLESIYPDELESKFPL